MRNTEQPQSFPQQGRRTKSLFPKRRKKITQPLIAVALNQAELAKMIAHIREEVEFHNGRAVDIRTKMEKLTSAANAELLRVKELKEIVESLKNNGHQEKSAANAKAAPTASALPPSPAGSAEQRKQELDGDLDKLVIITRLLEDSLPRPAKKNGPAALPAANGPKKILVIDDDPITVQIIAHFLQKENYVVASSQSGIDGLKKAFKENPSLILLDIMMPDLNGFQFLSIYRKDEENARAPVIILSSLAEEADVLKGLEIGAVDYIIKPFSPQVLLAKIKKNIISPP